MRAFALAALLADAVRAECSGSVEVTWSYLLLGAAEPTPYRGYAMILEEVEEGDHLLVVCGVGKDATLATLALGGRRQAFYVVCEDGGLSMHTTGSLGDHHSHTALGASISLFLTGDAEDVDDLTDSTILRSACGFVDPGREGDQVFSPSDELFSPGAEVENLVSLMVGMTLSERSDVPYGSRNPSDFSGAAADMGDTLDYIDQVRALDPMLAEDFDVFEVEEPARAWDGGHPPADYEMEVEKPPPKTLDPSLAADLDEEVEEEESSEGDGAESPPVGEGEEPPPAGEGKRESEEVFA